MQCVGTAPGTYMPSAVHVWYMAGGADRVACASQQEQPVRGSRLSSLVAVDISRRSIGRLDVVRAQIYACNEARSRAVVSSSVSG